MKIRKITETKTYTTNDVDVNVRINFYDNKISLVDRDGRDKQWLFANRGVEFMNGWLNILEAMKVAVKEAKIEYENELAETSKFSKNNFELILKPIIKKKK